MNLPAALADIASKAPSRPVIFYGEQQVSYGQLLDRTYALANHLRENLGLRPGGRVALWLKNCPEFVPAMFGILAAGGVVTPINNFLKPHELGFILNDAEADLLITDSSAEEALQALRTARPGLKSWQIEEFPNLQPAAAPDLGQQTENDVAVIIYTSGTTGHPKGAMLSHGNLLANVESCRCMLKAVSADRFVVVLPMFHSFMMTVGVLLPALVGGSMVLVKSLHPPKNIIQEIIMHQATILPCIPQFFRALANAPLPPNLPLRICVSGGAPLPVEILREFRQKMSIPLLEGYGLSEASPVVSMNPLKGPWKEGSIGIPVPGVEVSVQDDNGQSLSPGQTGEICVRGGNVMLGYWKQPEETSKVLRNGWLLTGDIGHADQEGYLFITDRKKDMLLVNGINVYPREIEEILYQFPGVKEAAVIGVPDARRGEQPMAFVATNEGAVLEEKLVQQFVRDRLADYKVPKKIVFVPALPRNATGKILKTALRQQAAGAL
jgi:long-chain acyl-CoA synthetase